MCLSSIHHFVWNIFLTDINLYLQLHYEAWVRFIVLSIVAIGVYAFYGQHHAHPTGDREVITYHKAPEDEAL